MDLTKEKPSVGFIGLGIMGASMAGHIQRAGFRMHVHTRTKNKRAEALIEQGAVWKDSIAELAAKSRIIISMVGFPKDVEQVYFGPSGILKNAGNGSIAIDMTTSDPALAEKLYLEGKKRGIAVLDAPVSGGDSGAQNASLSIMAGGDQETFEKVRPLLEILGNNIVFQGKAGAGQHTKMANQIAISSGMMAVCEALAYAKKAGLAPERVMESISQGAADSWSLRNLGPRILRQDPEPGFFIKHFIKDLTIALAASQNMGLDTPGLSLTLSLYQKLAEQGLGEKGTQALFTRYL